MPDISQLVLPSGTTYDVKDAVARSAITVWYGTCSTAAGTAQKDVTIVNPTSPAFNIDKNNIVVVKFDNNNTSTSATLKVGSLTAKSIKMYGTTAPVSQTWSAGAVVTFIYDGTNFLILSIGGTTATTAVYGYTKLNDTITSTSTSLAATANSVKKAVDEAKSYTDTAIIGNASFQGVVNAGTEISGLTSYKKGWYWVVGTAGTYVGVEHCEIGDFIFCIKDYASAYSASDFNIVQANIDMSIFKAFAYANSGSGSYTPSGTVSTPTFTGTAATITVSGTIANSVTLASQASSATGAADVTPNGSVSQATFTGTAKHLKATPGTTTVNSITAVGTLPSCTLPSFSATVSGEVLTLGWSAGSFSAGTLPTKGSNTTVANGTITLATQSSSATGTVDITPAGTISEQSFTGTTKYVKATVGTASKSMSGSYTPAGTVSQPTFSGTQGTVTVTPVPPTS